MTIADTQKVLDLPPRRQRRLIKCGSGIVAPPFAPVQRGAFLLLLLFLGLISFAAVEEINIGCENEYLLTDNGARLMTDDGRFLTTGRRWLVVADDRLPLPEWMTPILADFGLIPDECR